MAMARTGNARQAIALVEAFLETELHLRTGKAETCHLYLGYAEALVRAGDVERGLSALDHALSVARSIKSPWLIVECLGLRSRVLSEMTPGDPRIVQDLAEQRAICDQFGVVPWAVSRVAA